MNTKDLVIGESIFALFKGDPKAGKSVAAHSFPDTYTFSFDRRMKSVKAFYPDRNFEYDEFTDLIKVNNRIDELKRDCPFKTIIFDGLTKYAELAISCMITARNPQPNSKTVRAGIPMWEIEDFGGEYRALLMARDGLLAVNLLHKVNVIFIAHVLTTETTDLKTKIARVTRSLLTGGKKIAASFPSDFDETYHFYVHSDPQTGEPEFIATTRSNDTDWASTVLDLPTQISWTNKNFCDTLLSAHRMRAAGKELFT